ncbi:MAG: hypothetical protein ACE5DN_06420, partial [Flavobacteriales bacterium]
MNLSIIRSLLLSVAAFMVSNCSVVAGNVTVSGTITNPVSKKICIKPDVFLSEQGCNSAMLDEKGGFLVTFDLKANGYFKFIHGHEYTIMYLEPGYNIDITINPEEFDETISYKGKGAEPNNYLASKYLLVEKLMGDMSEFYELAPLDFIKKNNSIRRATEREFITRCSGSDISDDFRKLERPSLMYNWADMLLKYKMYHEGLTNDDLQAIAPTMKDVYALNREQPELLGARTYRDFLMDLLFDNAAQALKA